MNLIHENLMKDNDGYGIYLDESSANAISRNNVTNNWDGIGLLDKANENNISENHIERNIGAAICFDGSSYNTISKNRVTNNKAGFLLSTSSRNVFSENNLTDNNTGVSLFSSSWNRFYHNNFINNTVQVHIGQSDYINFWDGDYPSGGNYWSDYIGLDNYSGLCQNETGSDGIGDVPYQISDKNQDRYPLIIPTYIRLTGDINMMERST